mgnify:CR=1 FL=1
MLALPLQKVVVAAESLFREITADRWAMFVDGAVPFFLIEKHAGAFVDVIFAMPQHASLVFFFVLREFLFGLFVSQVEPFGQPLNVAFVDSDPVIRTTIAGAFGAIVFQLRFFRRLVPVRLQNGQFFFRHNLKFELCLCGVAARMF